MAAEHAVPADLLGKCIGIVPGFLYGIAEGGDAEHAAAVRDDLAVCLLCACLEDLGSLRKRGVKTCDHVALPRRCRVALCSKDDADSGTDVIGDQLAAEIPLAGRVAELCEIGVHTQHDGLGLGIAEAAVELDDLRISVFIDHEAGVEEADVFASLACHSADGRGDDAGHDLLIDVLGDDRGRGVGAHSAGVGAGVSVADALVVLAGGHRQNIDAVGHDDEGGLLAVEVVLNDYPGAGAAELVAAQHVTGRAYRGLSVHGDNHALAGGESVSLDDHRSAVLLDVGDGLLLVSEGLVLRGRDVVP